MNKYLFIFLAIGLFSACEQDSTSKEGGDSAAVNQPVESSGKVNSPTPAGNTYMESLLTKNYWVFEFFIPKDDSDMQARLFNRGRWYHFNPDGTYESGHWQESEGKGIWKFFMEDGEPKIWIDSVVDSEDSEFKLKANGEGDAMSWVGTSKYSQGGIMIKAINLLTMPTKKQFGVEE